MAIQGNFKGTTQSGFQIGKRGATVYGTTTQPSTPVSGDIWVDPELKTINVYNANVSAWSSIGSFLTDLNVDTGTLFVDSRNDTVSIGSESSNEKLFVNGNLRLGTNPSFQHSGAYMDMRHSNGGTTNIRVRDNTSGTDPIFKVFDANNVNEVFKVQGNLTIHDYTMPSADGSGGQVITTDGNGNLTFADVSEPVEDYGLITEATTSTSDYGLVSEATHISNIGGSRFTEKTGNYTMNANEKIIVDSTLIAITITLPANPVLGDEVKIIDGGLNASVNNITVSGNGANIDGVAQDLTIDTNGAAFGMVYYNSAKGWILTER